MLGVLLLAAAWLWYLTRHAGTLVGLSREPVMKCPVLILESDDWGAGPLEQADALRELADLLASRRNAKGEAPLMTLGIVLEIADRDAMRLAGEAYRAQRLNEPAQSRVASAILRGIELGVFTPQLHGMAHYWPSTLLDAGRSDAGVRQWLAEPGLGWTELLPSPIQSRWTNASTLPSTPLATDAIDAAVADEARMWQRLFGAPPSVAVASTFVWDDVVERAWSRVGIRAIVTPGRRYTMRDARGNLAGAGRVLRTGDAARPGVNYLVRDCYFEPRLGHDASTLEKALLEQTALGRATLVETHRANYCGPLCDDDALRKLGDGLHRVLTIEPNLRFISTAGLNDVLVRRDPTWVEGSPLRRTAAFLRRVRCEHSLWQATRIVIVLTTLAAILTAW